VRCSTLVDPLVYQLEVHYAGQRRKSPDFDITGTLAENAASLHAVPETMARGGLKAVLLTGQPVRRGRGRRQGPLRVTASRKA